MCCIPLTGLQIWKLKKLKIRDPIFYILFWKIKEWLNSGYICNQGEPSRVNTAVACGYYFSWENGSNQCWRVTLINEHSEATFRDILWMKNQFSTVGQTYQTYQTHREGDFTKGKVSPANIIVWVNFSMSVGSKDEDLIEHDCSYMCFFCNIICFLCLVFFLGGGGMGRGAGGGLCVRCILPGIIMMLLCVTKVT